MQIQQHDTVQYAIRAYTNHVSVDNKAQWFSTKVYEHHSLCMWSVMHALVGQLNKGWDFFLPFSGCQPKRAGWDHGLSWAALLCFWEANSLSSGAVFLFHRPFLLMREARVCFYQNPLLAGWGYIVSCKVWEMPLMSQCRLTLRKRPWRHFV